MPVYSNCVENFEDLQQYAGEGSVAVDWENTIFLGHPVHQQKQVQMMIRMREHAADLKTQASFVFSRKSFAGIPQNFRGKISLNMMGLPTFYLDS